MARAHILVLHNRPVLPARHPDEASEAEIVETADAVARDLRAARFLVGRLALDRDPIPLLRRLRRRRPDAVFNLFEGTGDDPASESLVAAVLENERLPFTGSQAATLTIARDKRRAKLLFLGAGLPTPAFIEVNALPMETPKLRWPLIIKPTLLDASIGLDQRSVVTEAKSMRAKVRSVLSSYGPPILVEEYIDGREFNVAVTECFGKRQMALGEVQFTSRFPWRVVTYAAKWHEGSREDLATPVRYPAAVSATLGRRLRAIASAAFDLLGCRDYARADFRVAPGGRPFLLEMNPNPGYHPAAGLARGLATLGLTHAEFTVAMVRAALRRGKRNR